MHPKTFEEIQVGKDDIEDWQFLVDGEDMEVKLIFFNGKVIGRALVVSLISFSFVFISVLHAGAELPIKYDYVVTAIDENKSR